MTTAKMTTTTPVSSQTDILRPAENLSELREHEAEADQRPKHAEFLEHGQITDAGLFAFALRKFLADEDEKEDERRESKSIRA